MQITDDLLYKYVPKAEKLMLEKIPMEHELTHVFLKSFERKMKKLTENKLYSTKLTISIRHKVAVVLIVLVLLFSTVMSVEAFRTRFFEMIIEIYRDLTSIMFIADEPSEIDFQVKKPSYIPEGYVVTEEERHLPLLI